MRTYYELCSCGGEFKGISGATFDMYPASYPVQCKQCNKTGMATLMREALDAGWSEPPKTYIEFFRET